MSALSNQRKISLHLQWYNCISKVTLIWHISISCHSVDSLFCTTIDISLCKLYYFRALCLLCYMNSDDELLCHSVGSGFASPKTHIPTISWPLSFTFCFNCLVLFRKIKFLIWHIPISCHLVDPRFFTTKDTYSMQTPLFLGLFVCSVHWRKFSLHLQWFTVLSLGFSLPWYHLCLIFSHIEYRAFGGIPVLHHHWNTISADYPYF